LLAKHKDARNYYNALYRLGETSLMLGDPKAAEIALADLVAKRPDDPLLEFALPYLGRAQHQNGKSADAKRTLTKALDKFPKGRLQEQCRYDLAQAHDQLGDKEEARRLLASIAADSAGKLADNALLTIGTAYFEDRDYAAALKAFEDLEQRFPKSPWLNTAKLNRALCLYQLKRYDQAQRLLDAQTSNSPDVPEGWYWLGMTQKARGQFDLAANTLLDAHTRFSKTALAAEMLFHAAHAQFQRGEYKSAMERFQQVVSSYPKHDLVDDALYYAVEAARASDQHERATALASRFFRDHPQSPVFGQVMLAAGQSLIELGRNDEAGKFLADLDARKPGASLAIPARYYYGLALRSEGKQQEAIRVLESLAEFNDSEDPALRQVLSDARFLVGSCYFENKEYSLSLPPLQEYLSSVPDGEVAGHAVSYLAVGMAELGRFKELPGVLEKMRSKAPRDVAVPAMFRVAEACFEAKEYSLAADLYTEIAGQDPSGPFAARALSGLGWARYHDGKYAAAAQAFGRVLESNPPVAMASEAEYVRARALEADDKLGEAVVAYQAVLSKYPQSVQAPDASLQLARTLKKQGKDSDAITAYEETAKRFPQSKQLDVVLYEWGWALQQNRLDAESQRVFERLASEFPDSSHMSDAVINVCETLYQDKQFSAVVSRLKPLLSRELQPAVREAVLYRLARTQVELSNWTEAKSAFEHLASDFPHGRLRREAEFWIAESDRQLGQTKAAIEQFTRLISDQGASEPWLGTAYLRLAQAQGEQKLWKDLLATIEQLRKLFPKYELMNVADYHAGRALQNLARFDEARESYRRGIAGRSDENAAQCQFMIGETFFHQKRFQEALREFLKVEILYAFPQWQADALLEAGKCHESLQEWSRAAETYNRILEKYPKTPHVQEAAKRRAAALQRVTADNKK
jgi:TolA-binding protein